MASFVEATALQQCGKHVESISSLVEEVAHESFPDFVNCLGNLVDAAKGMGAEGAKARTEARRN